MESCTDHPHLEAREGRLCTKLLVILSYDHLCSLVVRVPGYRSRGPVSIPDATKVVGLERVPLSLVSTIESYLEEKIAAPVEKAENTTVGISRADYVAPTIRKIWH
jgi:hypothetical protein